MPDRARDPVSLAEVADFVAAQRHRIAAQRQAAAVLGRTTVEQAIEASLGTVVVDIWGELLEVRLNRAGLRVADRRTVGQRIVRAIHAAESRATQLVESHIRSWS